MVPSNILTHFYLLSYAKCAVYAFITKIFCLRACNLKNEKVGRKKHKDPKMAAASVTEVSDFFL